MTAAALSDVVALSDAGALSDAFEGFEGDGRHVFA
jgi:hypothetical protein